jgi:uncharacterized protein (TIGR02246 family)
MKKHLTLPAAIVLIAVGVYAWSAAQPGAGDVDKDKLIRKQAAGYTEAFNKGDLDALMTFWAADADYVDDTGRAYKGKAAIGEAFKQYLAALKGCTLKLQVTAVRFLKDDVALEDGTSELAMPGGRLVQGRYSAIWTRTDGKWLLSSVRDLPHEPDADRPATHLKELEWMVGEWTAEDDGASVTLSARWLLGNSFQQHEYTVKAKDGTVLNVLALVGWDPLAGQLKSWVFDSRGGWGEGLWTRDGNTWKVASLGILPDGRKGSATNAFKYADAKTFSWHSTGREIEGVPVPDTDVKFTRKQAP